MGLPGRREFPLWHFLERCADGALERRLAGKQAIRPSPSQKSSTAQENKQIVRHTQAFVARAE
jgi:hypothetical protein